MLKCKNAKDRHLVPTKYITNMYQIHNLDFSSTYIHIWILYSKCLFDCEHLTMLQLVCTHFIHPLRPAEAAYAITFHILFELLSDDSAL